MQDPVDPDVREKAGASGDIVKMGGLASKRELQKLDRL
jgi:hypothetical protein